VFENILFQETSVTDLRSQIQSGTLPRALLFYGPAFSGKGSCAMELARSLTCAVKGAPWDCNCPSCKKHRLLNHHGILCAGAREFEEDLLAGFETLCRNQSTGSVYQFYRNVKKILVRFHPEIWIDEESRVKNLTSLTGRCEELLEEFEPEKIASVKDIRKKGEALVEAAMKLVEVYPEDNIPIWMVRNINQWIHRSNEGIMKIVILENADRMLDASRNALLKSLEEPPANTCFILTASRRESLIPTIRSRLRPYRFVQRTGEQEKTILSKLFKEDAPFAGLADFFQSHHPVNDKSVAVVAERFWHLLRSDGHEIPVFLEELRQFCAKISQKKHLKIFLSSLERKILEEVKASAGAPEAQITAHARAAKIEGLMRSAVLGYEVYNQNAHAVLEALFYDMKAAV
jgi:DNA polymerase-3 subunit gamma/tau